MFVANFVKIDLVVDYSPALLTNRNIFILGDLKTDIFSTKISTLISVTMTLLSLYNSSSCVRK